ncbi:MAG TPA: hypothetical protein PLQ36_01465 [Candidatus Gracilibacteria bacterium]|nr:hypothetical protein [Candidatus Gracilibacteria bacterium]
MPYVEVFDPEYQENKNLYLEFPEILEVEDAMMLIQATTITNQIEQSDIQDFIEANIRENNHLYEQILDLSPLVISEWIKTDLLRILEKAHN